MFLKVVWGGHFFMILQDLSGGGGQGGIFWPEFLLFTMPQPQNPGNVILALFFAEFFNDLLSRQLKSAIKRGKMARSAKL